MATGLTSEPRRSISDLVQKRRLNSRSDDEIEENIDSRLSYRKGWPILAPLPLRIVYDGGAISYFPNRAKHIPKIELLLQLQRVEPRSIDIVDRVPFAAAKTDESTATLLITAEPGTGNMFMAVRDIRKYLSSQDIHVAIELIDERAHWMRTYPVTSVEPATIESWKTMRNHVVDYLDESGIDWVSVNVLHRGLDMSKDLCPPTIVISARNAASSRWWDEILPNVRNMCRTQLEVELVREDEVAFDPYELAKNAGGTLNIDVFDKIIPMGASCGPVSSIGSGTIGGGVTLRRNGQDLGVFALSNHHVVKSELIANAIDANTALEPSHSLISSNSLPIKSPSDRDANLKVEKINESIARARGAIDGTPTNPGLQAMVDMGEESKRRYLESRLQAIQKNEADLQLVREFDRTVGQVYATSGHRHVTSKSEDWALDWSLTTVLPQRLLENKVDDTSSDDFGDFGELRTWHKRYPGGREVAKLGRSTGWTKGTVSKIEVIFSAKANPYKSNVVAWCVVSKEAIKHFAVPGDSGSVILDAEGDTMSFWMGLLFAANVMMGTGYYTPIDLVLDDISAVTGCDVVEPVLYT